MQAVSNLIERKSVEAACNNIPRLFVLNLILVNAPISARSRDNSQKLDCRGEALGLWTHAAHVTPNARSGLPFLFAAIRLFARHGGFLLWYGF
jgi:hypothetical protein